MNKSIHIFKNFASLFSGNIVSQIIIFYGMIRLAGMLPPEQFGSFSLAQVFALFFVRLSEFGLETIGIRTIAVKKGYPALVSDIVITRLLLMIISFFIAWSVLMFLPFSERTKDIIQICMLSLVGMSISLEWFYQANEEMYVVGVTRVLRSVIFVFPLFLPFLLMDDILTSWLYVGSFFIASILLMIYYRQRTPLPGQRFSIKRAVELLKESAPVGVAATLMQIPFNAGTFVIGIVLTNNEVGMYSAAYRLALVIWSFGIVAAYNAFFPTMSSLVNRNDEFEKFTKGLSRVFMVLSGFIVLSAVAFSDKILNLLYHGKYNGSQKILFLSFIVVAIVLMRTAVEYSLLARNRQLVYMKGMILVSILYLALGFASVQRWGINGMLYAAVAAEILYTGYVFYHFDFPKCRTEIGAILLKVIIVTAVSTMVYYSSRSMSEWFAASIMFGTFGMAVFMTKVLEPKKILQYF